MSEQEKSIVSETDETKIEKQDNKQKTKPAKKTKKPSKIKKWFRDLKAEAKKVVWPSKKQVMNNTVIVLVTVLIAVLVIAGLDFVFKFISDALINLG